VEGFVKQVRFKPGVKEWRVMDGESGESRDHVTGARGDKSETERLTSG